MNILICAVQFKGGSLQVAISLVKEYIKHPKHDYYVIMSREVEKQLKGIEFPSNFHFYPLPYPFRVRLMNSYYRHFFLSKIEKETKPDCIICTSGPIYWKPKAPLVMGYNLGHMIYPESPYFKRLLLWKRIRWQVRFLTYRYCYRRESKIIFVQTDDVKNRLQKIFKFHDVYTISNTYNNAYKNPMSYPNKLPQNDGCEFRLLMLSAFYMHKNFEIIPCIIDELIKRKENSIRFVLTLPENIFQRVFSEKHRAFIHNAGFVPTLKGPSLYKECDVMFLPTLLECFSASYAEAMVMQKPIMTSDLGFAHTVCKNAAIYFDPENAVEIADKIIMLKNDEKLQKKLISMGNQQLSQFGTSEDRAERILELCNDLVGK